MTKRLSGIYRIFNKVNGKGYVGSACNLARRNNEHFAKLRARKHHNKYLESAWYKYGEDNFKFEILEVIDKPTKKKLEERENYWINYYDAANPEKGYNLYPVAGSPLGKNKDTILKNQKNILDFCKKYGYKPSSHSKNKFELKLASNLENYFDREYTENCIEFKKQVLKYPSKREFITIENQKKILQFCKENGYRPCEDTGSEKEQDLGSLLRAYMNEKMRIKYPVFTKEILTYSNKRTKSSIDAKRKILEFCEINGYRPRAHVQDQINGRNEKILGHCLSAYVSKNSFVYDKEFVDLVKKFPTCREFKKLQKVNQNG